MKPLLIVLFLSLIFSKASLTQAGLHFSTGMSKAYNQDLRITADGSHHPGYFIGADAILIEGKMYFVLVGQYQQLDLNTQSPESYLRHGQAMRWWKLRAGLGFELFRLGKSAHVDLNTLGSINILSNYNELELDSNWGRFNNGTAALAFKLSLSLQYFSVFTEYEQGLVNSINQVKKTQFRILSLGVGLAI